MRSVPDPDHLPGGEAGRTPSFQTSPLAESTNTAPEPADVSRITASLKDESEVHAEGGEAPPNEESPSWQSRPRSPVLDDIDRTPPNEGSPSWQSRPGSPVPDVIDRNTPEVGLTNPQPGSSAIVTNTQLPPLDPGFTEAVKFVVI